MGTCQAVLCVKRDGLRDEKGLNLAKHHNPADLAPATKAVTGGRRSEWTSVPGAKGGVVNPPVWRASTHLYDNVADLRAGVLNDADGQFFYGRRGGPTQWALAEALTELEPGAFGTVLFSSGVAAIHTALLSVLKPGDVLLMTDNAYDPSRSFATGFLKDWGVEARFFDPSVGGGIADHFCDRTAAILLESPGSLTFEVQDVPAMCAAAKERGIVTLLDNTWSTPLLFPALSHGVDITILAATKYIVGHSDVMMGSVTAGEAHYQSVRKTAQALGQVVSPDDAYLALRGLRTLSVRLKAHEAAALEIARWLNGHPDVARVLHPALQGCPGHDIWRRDFRGSSGLFAFELIGDDAPNSDRAARFVDALTLFGIGYSWGGFESLALPINPARCRTAVPWNGEHQLIRLHIGLEDVGDLIADLERGFAA
jgi:cysteine-S-conjugate beta-lyase